MRYLFMVPILVVIVITQQKLASLESHDQTTRNVVVVELHRIWLILCSAMLRIGLFTGLVDCGNPANYYYFWFFACPFIFGILPVILASFAYPLGNRKMMEVCAGRLNAYQRVLGMTLASLPFWLLLSLYGVFSAGMPSKEQTVQSALVAVFFRGDRYGFIF